MFPLLAYMLGFMPQQHDQFLRRQPAGGAAKVDAPEERDADHAQPVRQKREGAGKEHREIERGPLEYPLGRRRIQSGAAGHLQQEQPRVYSVRHRRSPASPRPGRM